MALIRQVLRHPITNKWAYIEYSDENRTHAHILGGKEFDTMEEAEEWGDKFDPFSYKPRENNRETIEYDGKTYDKAEFERAINNLKPVKCEK